MAIKANKEAHVLGHCPVCRTKVKAGDTALIKKSKRSSTLYAECAKCGSSQILTIFRNAMGVITTVGMLTDLKKQDAERFHGLAPVTSNDIIEVHEWFEKNK